MFGLEGTSGDDLVHSPAKAGCTGTHPGGFYTSPERLHNLSGQTVPVLCHLPCNEVLPQGEVELPVL